MTDETQFAQAYIDSVKSDDHRNVEISQEVHYNHYGSRGCVDLVTVTEWPDYNETELSVIELKSDYAIEQATGANEIIRQMNKHYEYFFDGTSKYPRRKYDDWGFWLLFYATPDTVDHVVQNRDLYKIAESNHKDGTYNVALWREDVGICPISPDGYWEKDINAKELRQLAECGEGAT